MKKNLLFFLVFQLNIFILKAQNTPNLSQEKNILLQTLDSKSLYYQHLAQQIWNWAEVGYKEYKSAHLLQTTLKNEGFKIDSGVADIPTAFVATFGEGYPVIGILGEYDALPGISQDSTPTRNIITSKNAGHACGHHLFGVASVAAAIEIKNWLLKNNIKGTIKFFGTPAEEGGSGKVYMTKAGVFKNVDLIMHWHPSNANAVEQPAALANMSAKFRFKGIASHASASPEKGRSALDAVESMNYMANMMREHMPQTARMHYVITNGGKAPNVVPDFAEVYYYIRHDDVPVVKDLFNRLVKIAQGAALGTETSMEYENIGGTYNLIPILSLSKIMYQNMLLTNGYEYNDQELEFAKKISTTLATDNTLISKKIGIEDFWYSRDAKGSTDVGDVSWNVPTIGFRAATWVKGTPAHSWQAIACGANSISTKGLILAAKTLSLTALDLFSNTPLIQQGKKEFETFKANTLYSPLIGDRKPPLNYRD